MLNYFPWKKQVPWLGRVNSDFYKAFHKICLKLFKKDGPRFPRVQSHATNLKNGNSNAKQNTFEVKQQTHLCSSSFTRGSNPKFGWQCRCLFRTLPERFILCVMERFSENSGKKMVIIFARKVSDLLIFDVKKTHLHVSLVSSEKAIRWNFAIFV